VSNFFSSIGRAVASGWATFRKSYLATEPDYTAALYGDRYGDRIPRLVRYAVFWAAYENSLYDGQVPTSTDSSTTVYGDAMVHAWAGAFKQAMGLYRYTRGILNPVNRLVEFHATHVLGGELDDAAGDGVEIKSALPILEATDAHRAAIARLWRDSNWSIEKDTLVRQGAAKGDAFLAVCDAWEDGRVYLEVIPPQEISLLSKDCFGHVKGYVRERYRDDPDSPPRTILDLDTPIPQVLYSETAERDGDMVLYRTYRDRAPYAWDDRPQEWAVPYGFVPLWHIQHIPSGNGWGRPEAFSGLVKFCEGDEQASKLHDAVRKAVETTWLLSGVRQQELSQALAQAAPTAGKTQPGRNESLTICAQDPQAKASPMLPDLNVADVTMNLRFVVEQTLQDYPELRYELIRASGDANAKALAEARKPAEAKVRARRVAYDQAVLRATQAALAIGGWRYQQTRDPRLADYAGFSLDSYARGQLAFRIGPRPVFEATPADRIEDETARANLVKALIDAGVPLPMALARAEWDEDSIEEIEDHLDELAREESERLAALATATPPANPQQQQQQQPNMAMPPDAGMPMDGEMTNDGEAGA